MSRQSRRSFLAAAGAGSVAALGAGTLLGASGASRAEALPADDTPADAQVVAFISDPEHDEVTLMSGEQENVVHDPTLARALARAARKQEV